MLLSYHYEEFDFPTNCNFSSRMKVSNFFYPLSYPRNEKAEKERKKIFLMYSRKVNQLLTKIAPENQCNQLLVTGRKFILVIDGRIQEKIKHDLNGNVLWLESP
jgi:hypothetical protein